MDAQLNPGDSAVLGPIGRSRISLAGLLLASLLGQPLAAQNASQLDEVFANFASNSSPGCAVAVSEPSRPPLTRAYGMANLEHAVPITPSTVFEAGSVAKQFAAAAILLLVQDGALSLQDDVRKFVPELPDYGAPITIDNLLTHTSGLREWGEVADLGGWAPRTFDDVLEIVSRQRNLNAPPGTQFEYVGTGFTLAATVVERVTGTSLAQFSAERIFGPLEMSSTRWHDDFQRVVPERATAYRARGTEYVQSMPPSDNIYGHGSLLTTVGDLLIWNESLASDRLGPIVTTKLHGEARTVGGRSTGYGRGVFIDSYRGWSEIHHDGGYGAFRAWLARYPEHGVSIALLCNTVVPNIITLGRRVADLALPASSAQPVSPGAAPSSAEGVTLLPGQAEQYVGVFISDKTGMPIVFAADQGQLRADGFLLSAVGQDHFRVSWGELIFKSPDLVQLVRPNGERILLRRVHGEALTPTELSALSGRYRSEEAAATYVVVAGEDGLVLRLVGQPSHVYSLKPTGRDVFHAPNMVVRFYRDPAGDVSSFGITVPRVRDLRFFPESPSRSR